MMLVLTMSMVACGKKNENTDTELEDLISIGSIGLIKAVNSFNADKNIKIAKNELAKAQENGEFAGMGRLVYL